MLPDLTHLQFLVLTALMGDERSGRYVREELAKHSVKKSLASFYQLMSRLEDAKFVEGRYEHKTIDGYAVKERYYKVTGLGQHAWEQTREFYARAAAKAGMPLVWEGA